MHVITERWLALFTVDKVTGQLSYAGMDFVTESDCDEYCEKNKISAYVVLPLVLRKEVEVKTLAKPIAALERSGVTFTKPDVAPQDLPDLSRANIKPEPPQEPQEPQEPEPSAEKKSNPKK